MDFFTEQLYSRKKGPMDYLMQIGLFVLSLILSMGVFIIFNRIQAFGTLLGTVAIVGIVFGAYKIFMLFEVEFEYIYLNGEIDIDKIIAKTTRTRLLTVNSQDFQHFGPYSPDKVKNLSPQKTFNVSSNTDKPLYYAYFRNKVHGNTLLIFEPKEEILNDLKKYTRDAKP